MKKILVEKELRLEIIVGGFAFVVVLGLFLFSIFVTGEVFVGREQKFPVVFDDVMGLVAGDNVVVRGMKIGEVKSLELTPGRKQVKVVCYLHKRVELRGEYKITIQPTSILGGRRLSIYEGDRDADRVPDGELIEGETPSDLVVEAGRAVSVVRRTLEDEGVLDDLKRMVRSSQEIVTKINEGKGSLGLLVNDKGLYEELKKATACLKTIADQLGPESKGALARMIHDEEIYKDMKTAVANLNEVSRRLVDGKSLFGQMLSEEGEMSEQVKLLLQELRAAVDDFRETAPILTFTSVFFGAL